ncbi:MAG: hypothetical protein ACRYG7_38830 [Janthinobacterium lividum]
MKQYLLSLALLGGLATAAQAQTPAKPAPTAAELKKNFALISAGAEGESDAFDELTTTTARRLVTYLKTHEVSAAEAKSLGLGYLAAKGADYLRVFTYSYSSGGTRGEITQSVFQWKNQAGQLFAYAAHDEGSFTKIYKLASPGRAQYLMLGNEQGSSICMRGIAWLVELKGNYLLLNKQAFDNKPTLDICNVELTYEVPNQTLVVAGGSPFGDPDVYADKPFKPFKLYFSQGRFIKKK